MILYGILSIILGIFSAFICFLGGAYIGDKIYNAIGHKKGNYSFNFDIRGINGEDKSVVKQRIENRVDISGASKDGIIGKIISLNGKAILPICVCLANMHGFCARAYQIVYIDSRGSLGETRIDREEYNSLLKKYNTRGQIRSREIRRDVRSFCENYCIQDCTGCVLKCYGKIDKTKQSNLS